MKRIILILGLAASIGLMGTGSVHAQFVVHDPGHTLLNSTEWNGSPMSRNGLHKSMK